MSRISFHIKENSNFLCKVPLSKAFFSTSAYFVNGNTLLISDLTDNDFYPSAERIWLYIHLKNAEKYCDITLKIIVMLQNVC